MNLNKFLVNLKFCEFFFANLGGMQKQKYGDVYKFVQKYTDLEIEDIKSFFESPTQTGSAVADGVQEEDVFLVNVPGGQKISMPDEIKIYYQNVRSIKNKMGNFDSSLVPNYHIIIFTETWLTKNQKDFTGNMKVFNSEFAVYRRDRSEKVLEDRGGGVMIAI